MGGNKTDNQEIKTSASGDTLGEGERKHIQTQETKKRFWSDWVPLEKLAALTLIFTVIYSIVTAGLYLVARDSLRIGQRAFVYAEAANILNSPKAKTVTPRPSNAPITLDVTFRNSGQTVARKVITTVDYLVNKDGIPVGFDYPVRTTTALHPTLIPPQTDVHLSENILESDLSDVENQKTFLFVYGEISYVDVFGTSHRTKYCFQYFGYKLNPVGELENYIFFTGPRHNCTDEDCDNEK